MIDENSDAEGRADDRPRGPSPSGFEDNFWLVALALIVVILFLVGLMGADTGPASQDGYTGWH
ncbi:hypothetical protein ACKI1I_20440 [Streptomyces turgidiscabies]|uniref:Uncharacterized protein n=1 Tax=Streptomyces turgidiscabies (strain Car8) TaxID=698760 RepID=L7FHH5_STRT8|nr:MULTISPECIES: hypothetical protein [Streptomyces]ELP70145.1 hypothetical protein STRTUCAR8_10158 [Streptomyces turgidiscabies Car8]MDX3496708.1 hypothetical protein [Streptomyces turgidiscabies]GAQ72910.1 hypothetical protein T45_04666 [Streptomyces turgidiscabies]